MRTKPPQRLAAAPQDLSPERALARLADAQPYVVLYDQEVFPVRAGEPFLIARSLGIGDVILPGPNVDDKPRRGPPPIPRLLTAREIARDVILDPVRRSLPPGCALAALLWPDGTIALTVMRIRAALPAWWAFMTYDVARCAPKLAEITNERDAERGNAKPGDSHARP